MRLVLREIRLLKTSAHPNVVSVVEAFRSKSGRIYLAMEFCERTLIADLKSHPFGFTSTGAKLITWQLLQATAFLHSNRVGAPVFVKRYCHKGSLYPFDVTSAFPSRSSTAI